MIRIKTLFKYETPFKGLHESVQTWKNGSVTLQTGVVMTIVNILHIKRYESNKEEANVLNQ